MFVVKGRQVHKVLYNCVKLAYSITSLAPASRLGRERRDYSITDNECNSAKNRTRLWGYADISTYHCYADISTYHCYADISTYHCYICDVTVQGDTCWLKMNCQVSLEQFAWVCLTGDKAIFLSFSLHSTVNELLRVRSKQPIRSPALQVGVANQLVCVVDQICCTIT